MTQTQSGPSRRLYIEIGVPRDFIRTPRNAPDPLLPRPKTKED